MGFQKILAGETDTNSPLNQALMDKIRENFDYLAENMLLACLDAEVTRTLGGGTWQTVKTGNVFVPSFVSGLTFRVESYYSYEASGRKLRVKVEDGPGGHNVSGEETAPANGYDYRSFTVPGSGSFSGAGAWRRFYVESKHDDVLDRDIVMRTVVCKVETVQ
jgi:hypothetical protein